MSKPVLARLLSLFLLPSFGCVISERQGQDREDDVDLKLLSVEQRQILRGANARRAQLVGIR